MVVVHKELLPTYDLVEMEVVCQGLNYKKCPPWLGNFYFKQSSLEAASAVFKPLFDLATVLCPGQTFNRLFVQRYKEGQWVKEHRDPKNNTGHTIILVLGRFLGAVSSCEEQTYHLHFGDIAVQPCTINGVQGPKHSVTPVLSGTRYAVILNTIDGS